MNWKLKAWIQRALAALPPSLGDPIYHGLQSLNGLKPNLEGNVAFLQRVEGSLLNEHIPGLPGRKVVELGSGWYPVLPFLLLDQGVEEVITVDLNEHNSPARIREAAEAVLRHSKSRDVQVVLRETVASGRLPNVVRYYPRAAIQTLAPNLLAGADLAISRFVLEHVRPEDLVEIHDASHRWMTPDGLWVHWISPSDHRAFFDSNLHLVDFLRFSQKDWNSWAGNRYAHHNRLRLPQYRELFRQCGWRVVVEESEAASNSSIEGLKNVPLHPDFQRMDPKDLMAGSLWFVLGRSSAV